MYIYVIKIIKNEIVRRLVQKSSITLKIFILYLASLLYFHSSFRQLPRVEYFTLKKTSARFFNPTCAERVGVSRENVLITKLARVSPSIRQQRHGRAQHLTHLFFLIHRRHSSSCCGGRTNNHGTSRCCVLHRKYGPVNTHNF